MKTNIKILRNFTFVLLTGLILSSCTKKDTASDNIIGVWTVNAADLTLTVGDKTLEEYLVDIAGFSALEAQTFVSYFEAGVGAGITGSIEIKSDGTYTATLGGEADTGTWSLNSDGTMITIDSDSDDPMTLEILELTSGKLKIKMTWWKCNIV